MQVRELMEVLESIAPLSMAESYDNPGLIVGSGNSDVSGILVALDLSMDVINEAKDNNANVIITHHPLIFHAIKRIDTRSNEGKMISELIKNDMSYIAMHTNVDKCRFGLNDYLADVVGIQNLKILEDMTESYQVSVYVPKGNVEDVKNAMFDAGAGSIGGYRGCSFSMGGLGQFEPLVGAKPYLGEEGKIEQVDETKLEVYCDAHKLSKVIYAMVEAHPYEKPVYYAVKSKSYGEYGFGRYGELDEEMTLKQYCEYVKEKLNMPVLEFVGDENKKVRTVGVCSGAGGDMYALASALGLDAFITGDIKHNVAVLASQSTTALINGGHYGTETIFKKFMSDRLQNSFNELQWSVNIICSEAEKSPWSYV